jgi:hypothetical protein
MKILLATAVLTLVACSSAPVVLHQEAPPHVLPPPRTAAVEGARPTADNPATQAWLQGEMDRKVAAAPTSPATAAQPGLEPAANQEKSQGNEAATQQWLQGEVEHRNAVNPPSTPEPMYQVIEKPVYVDRYVGGSPYYYRGIGYDSCGEPNYGVYYSRGYYDYYPRSTFPLNTVVGAGIGSLVTRHHGRGAAIGAGVGLLFDLFGRR